MKLYLISQNENEDYDTFDSAVVAANSENEARIIHPGVTRRDDVFSEESNKREWEHKSRYSNWASSPEHVTVKYIGEAAPEIEYGIILASYNAG